MLLALSLLVAMPPPADEPLGLPEVRVDLVDALRSLMATIDGDHDGRLSRAEWSAATSRGGDSYSETDRASPIRMSIAAPPDEVFRDWDSNADGLVSFEEFAREPLASFDCVDADHDGIVQPAEQETERSRCSHSDQPESSAAAPVPAPRP